MKNKITILITGAGAPGIAGTIYSLRNNPDGINFKIVTTDIKNKPVGKFLSESFYRIPPPENKDYIFILEQIIKQEKVEVILPQTTREIIVLSQRKDEIYKIGASVVVSDYETIRKANDKYLVTEECKKIGIPYPKYYLVNNKKTFLKSLDLLGYPENRVVVKPRLSNGLRGLRIITENVISIREFLNKKPSGLEINLKNLLNIFKYGEFPELLIEEYLPGKEYTVDMFRNSKGTVIIPRIRESIRSGISFDTKIDLREDIIEYSQKLADSLDLKYCFGFQFKLDSKGVPKILESNPRVQGTMVTSTFAGFNMIYYSIKEVLGKGVDLKNIKIKNGVEFKRYWGGIGIDEENFLGRI